MATITVDAELFTALAKQAGKVEAMEELARSWQDSSDSLCAENKRLWVAVGFLRSAACRGVELLTTFEKCGTEPDTNCTSSIRIELGKADNLIGEIVELTKAE